jgi:translation initiation factor 2B subunit (eIF-2B alpha/beta/delta family)
MTTKERDTNMNDFIKYMQDYLVKLEQEIVEFTDDYAKAIDEDIANQFMEDILMTTGEKNAVKHLLKKAEEVTK